MKKVTVYIYQAQDGWQVVSGPNITSPAKALLYVERKQDEAYTLTPLDVEIPEGECLQCDGGRILRKICPVCSGNGCPGCYGFGKISFTCPCQKETSS